MLYAVKQADFFYASVENGPRIVAVKLYEKRRRRCFVRQAGVPEARHTADNISFGFGASASVFVGFKEFSVFQM